MAPKGASPYFLNSERSSVDQEYEYYTIYERSVKHSASCYHSLEHAGCMVHNFSVKNLMEWSLYFRQFYRLINF